LGLRLLLARDDEILCEVPLSLDDQDRSELDDEMGILRREMHHLLRTYSALTNRNRIRMLRTLMEDDDLTLSFKELMERLNMNPKIVREHAMRLAEAGFVTSPARGKYQLSSPGQALFMAVGPALLRISEIIREEYE
jgi:DNA-binding transcriptional ArsR family regulator